jgi:hypothetical protein
MHRHCSPHHKASPCPSRSLFQSFQTRHRKKGPSASERRYQAGRQMYDELSVPSDPRHSGLLLGRFRRPTCCENGWHAARVCILDDGRDPEVTLTRRFVDEGLTSIVAVCAKVDMIAKPNKLIAASPFRISEAYHGEASPKKVFLVPHCQYPELRVGMRSQHNTPKRWPWFFNGFVQSYDLVRPADDSLTRYRPRYHVEASDNRKEIGMFIRSCLSCAPFM